MKRIICMLMVMAIGIGAWAQVTVSGATAFGAVYDTAKGLPYWGIRPGVTVGLGADSLALKAEIGTYVVSADSVGTAMPLNINAVATIKDIPLTTLTVTGDLKDLLGTIGWSIAPAASVALGPLTPGVTVTIDKAFLLPTTWTLAFSLKGVPVTATATVTQAELFKLPGTVKLTGALTY